MKLILHVFPDRGVLMHHLDNLLCSGRDLVISNVADVYVDEAGVRHHCKAVRCRDDVLDLLGYVFGGFEKHGDFSHLSIEDGEYVDFMIASRVRKEVA